MIANAEAIKSAVGIEDVLTNLGYTLNSRQRCACPVHGGDDRNFSVKGGVGTCWSQCGGKTWDAIGLIQEVKGFTYPEALEYLASLGGLNIEYAGGANRKEIIERSKAESEQRESIVALNERALKAYCAGREIQMAATYSFDEREWSGEAVSAFRICETPDDNLLVKVAEAEQWNMALAEEAGLIRTSKEGGTLYDFFRNRILFPFLDHNGKLVGFTGRKRKGDTYEGSPKYKNSPETIAFRKERFLYGLWQNRRGIREEGALVVEGMADVVTLYQYGLRNVVGTGGTALTAGQLQLLKRYTHDLTLLFDGDKAGREATVRAVDLAIEQGFRVKVCLFDQPPANFGDSKYDPDNFMRAYGAGSLEALLESSSEDGLIWRVMQNYSSSDIFQKEAAIQLAARMISMLDNDMLQDFYIRELTDRKRMGKDAGTHLKEGVKREQEKRLQEANRPKLSAAQQADIIKYGVYENNNQYFVSGTTDAEGFPISNFIISPIMLVVGSQRSARLVEIRNVHGHKFAAQIDTDNFIEMSQFKKEVERRGNYLFWEGARAEHYTKIKRKVYDSMTTCFPISTLGYHKEGFWAWSNGIIADGNFQPIDEYGVVTYAENRYWLPAFSKINQDVLSDDDEGGYEDQKGFVYVDEHEAPTFQAWTRQMARVHGGNGMVAVAWFLAAIFRDVIYEKFQFFPHLNLFGPPQSGKSYLAWSIAYLFGKPSQPFHLVHGTDVAFFRTLAARRNAVAWFDEYSNQVHFKRVEALKAAYDGAGRPKGVPTADNRMTTTKVNSACIISGQQQPTQDVALFTRCISLNFRGNATDAEEDKAERRRRGEALKAIEATGCLSQLTSKLMKYRDIIERDFDLQFDSVRAELVQHLSASKVQLEDRILKNYAIPITVTNILMKYEDFGFKLAELLDFALQNMMQQAESITNQDELAVWWNQFEFLIDDGQLRHDQDLLVQDVTAITVKDEKPGSTSTTTIDFGGETKKVLFLNFSRTYGLYAERVRKEGGAMVLNREAIKYYLKISPAFIGQVRAKKFGGQAKSAYAFELDKLPFDLPLSVLENGPAPAGGGEDDADDMPF